MAFRRQSDWPLSDDPRDNHDPEWDWFWENIDGAYPFTDGAGARLLDFSGNGKHGTLENTPTWGVNSHGREIAFSGGISGDSVNLNTTFGHGGAGQAFTYACVVKMADPNTNRVLCGRVNGSTGEIIQIQTWDSTNRLRVAYGDTGGTVQDVNAVGSVTANVPAVVIFTYSTLDDGRLYVDGKIYDTNTSNPSAFADTTALHLGKRGGSTNQDWPGEMLLFAATHHEWTPAQVRQFSQDPYGPFREPDDYAAWRVPVAAGILPQRHYPRGVETGVMRGVL